MHAEAFPISISNAEHLIQSIMYSDFEEIEWKLKRAIALLMQRGMLASPMALKQRGGTEIKSRVNNNFSCV